MDRLSRDEFRAQVENYRAFRIYEVTNDRLETIIRKKLAEGEKKIRRERKRAELLKWAQEVMFGEIKGGQLVIEAQAIESEENGGEEGEAVGDGDLEEDGLGERALSPAYNAAIPHQRDDDMIVYSHGNHITPACGIPNNHGDFLLITSPQLSARCSSARDPKYNRSVDYGSRRRPSTPTPYYTTTANGNHDGLREEPRSAKVSRNWEEEGSSKRQRLY